MPRKKKPVVQIDDGEWVTIDWKGQHEECCNCGSKHRVDHRVLDTGKLQMRATRIK
jgi:hypothetical protein